MTDKRRDNVPLWAGVSAFFSSLVAIGVIDWLTPTDVLRYLGAIFVALVTGGAIYSKQKLEEARDERERQRRESGE